MIHDLSPETAALVAVLLEVPIGAEIAYSEMARALGRDPRLRGTLASARRVCARDHAAWFTPVRKVGLRRLRVDEAPDVGAANRRRIRRAAKRSVRMMTGMTAGANDLDADVQRRLSTELAAAGMIAHLAQDRATAALAQEDERPAPPAIAARSFLDWLNSGATRPGGKP